MMVSLILYFIYHNIFFIARVNIQKPYFHLNVYFEILRNLLSLQCGSTERVIRWRDERDFQYTNVHILGADICTQTDYERYFATE